MPPIADPLVRVIIGGAIEVHRTIGPGPLESAYETCFAQALAERQMGFSRHLPLPLVYKGVRLDCGYRVDFVVEERVIVEVTSVARLRGPHSQGPLG